MFQLLFRCSMKTLWEWNLSEKKKRCNSFLFNMMGLEMSYSPHIHTADVVWIVTSNNSTQNSRWEHFYIVINHNEVFSLLYQCCFYSHHKPHAKRKLYWGVHSLYVCAFYAYLKHITSHLMCLISKGIQLSSLLNRI